mmetsp:Transcript_55797/g.167213  ORF Transcript_55797/g.167213 Transcript_55797/m.167213 type:complete len:324 (-) Transcript_55797:1213-2184(-)
MSTSDAIGAAQTFDAQNPGDEVPIFNCILLPPWETHAIKTDHAVATFDVFVAISEAALSLDTVLADEGAGAGDTAPNAAPNNDPNADPPANPNGASNANADAAAPAPQPTPTFDAALPFFRHIWRWHQATHNSTNVPAGHVTVDPVLKSSRNCAVTTWAATFHATLLAPIQLHSDPNAKIINNGTGFTDVAQSLSKTASAFKRGIFAENTTRTLCHPRLSKTPEDAQAIILNASTIDGEVPALHPPPTLTDLMKKRMYAFAYNTLSDKITKLGCRCQPIHGTVANLYSGLWAASESGSSGKFTIFGFPKTICDASPSADSLAA